jgi:hypothetical protein
LPVFDPPLTNQRVILFNITKYEIPRIFDPDGDTVTFTEIFNNGSLFITFAESSDPTILTGTLTIDAKNPDAHIGNYTITYELNDGSTT